MRSRRVVFAVVLLAFAWAGVTCSAAMSPAGSRELAWIESDGAAWIDTGVRASSRVNLAFEGTVFDSAGYSCLVGADDKLAPEALGLWVNYEGRLALVRGGVTAPWLGESVLGRACVVSNCATRLFRNDKEVFANVEPATFASPLTLTVFNCRRNERSVESFAGRALHARLTRLRVWEGDALVRDFRPCRDSSGEAGLWDRVGGTFFGNRGKGRLRGSDEPPPPSCGERPLAVRRNLSRPGDAIRIGGFWGEQYRMLIEKWLPHCILQLEKGGHASGSHLRTYGEGLYNLRAAGEKLRGGHPWISPSRTWMDGVVFNVAEAMCLALEIGDDPALRAKLEEWIPVFLAAQEKSGYIHSMVTFTLKRGHYDRILARFPDRAESRLYRMSPAVAHGYREVKGAWELPLPEQKVTAIDEVKACAGQEAFQRGPLVYSWEGPNFTIKVPNYRRLNNGGESCVWKKK